jgi:hypothetical protein
VTNLDTTIQRQLSALEQKSTEQSLSKVIKLPEWPETKRATPNSFLRSALFSATQGQDNKDRPYLDGEILASQQGFTIKYTGLQLNQDDLTLWEALVHLAKEQPLGNVCKFTAYEILKSMGLDTGGDQRNRLHKGIIRLTGGVVEIIHEGRKVYFDTLIQSGAKDELTSHYKLQLSRQLVRLYSQNAWIDWEQRLQIRRKPLAQFLHGYYSSHQSPYPVKLETLHKLSGSRNKQKSGFKIKVSSALDELVEIGFLESYSFDSDLINVKRK